jgi:hypothetical protein
MEVKQRRKANSPTFKNNQTSLPMQLKKQPFEKLLHPPSFPPSLPSSKRTPVIPLSKGFSPLQKGRKSLGDEKSLGRKKEIKSSIFLLLSLNFHYNPIAPHFIPPHSTLERKKFTLDL